MIAWLLGWVIFSNECALIFSAEYKSNDCTTDLYQDYYLTGLSFFAYTMYMGLIHLKSVP